MKPKWLHDQKLQPNPALVQFLNSLKDGAEKLLEMEKAKLNEYLQAKNRMGG